jgi:hypothetical protein
LESGCTPSWGSAPQHCLPTNPPFPYTAPCQLEEARANTTPPFLNKQKREECWQ